MNSELFFYLTKKSSFHIDGWVEFSLSNRVTAIEFNLLNYNRRRSPLEHYTFPYRLLGLSALGSCLKNSCNMNPCMFVGFKFLKTLSLKVMGVGDEAVEYFLSNCLIFEWLFLHENRVLINLKVVGPSLMLRYLEVVGCWGVKTIEICATNLVSFTYDGELPKMLLKNVLLLVEVLINLYASIQFERLCVLSFHVVFLS